VVSKAIGTVALLVVATLQALLVFGIVRYEQAISAVLGTGAGVGLSLLVTNLHMVLVGTLPAELAGLGMAAGAGYLLSAVGFHLGGEKHRAFYSGSLLVAPRHSAWAVWLGAIFLSGWTMPAR
jgi:hypothetical protein